ncbi:MAG: type II toxin-antitoxin system VapC family toxin [Gemmatimonadota bacterium]|nr:type II toxin-antitoxin system VapC family toxin [Gemmatimonadota bacterium]
MGGDEGLIILDTHIWFCYINDGPEGLSNDANQIIHKNGTLGVSVISCREIAMLVGKGRLRLGIDIQDGIDRALKYKGIKLIHLTPEIAVLSTRLPGGFHNDPADRILAASCLHYGVSLITRDRAICEWGYIHTVS